MNEDLIGNLYLPQVVPTMAVLPTRLLATLFPQALGCTNKAVGGGRQTTSMASFGQLPFERFDALLLRPNGYKGLFESFAQVLIRLVQLVQFFVFTLQCFAPGPLLSPELFEFFI